MNSTMHREELLQFIWRSGLFVNRKMKTTCGKHLYVIRPGDQNFHSGPDFFDARIRIGEILWAGNVEVHLRSSDWERHGHHLDPSYNNVILHVVLEEDRPVYNSLGHRVLSLVIQIPRPLIEIYRSLMQADNWLACKSFIGDLPRIQLQSWLARLHHERLQHKTARAKSLLHRANPDREAALCMILSSGFGLPINSLPFEMTLSGIPVAILDRFKDNLLDLEALLFGQAGFLNRPGTGTYASFLFSRYRDLNSLLPGEPVDPHLWKLLRLRPASFPAIRLSQFAAFVHQRFPFLDTILGLSSLSELEQLFRVKASEYWDTHYLFGKCSRESSKYLGRQATQSLIINAVVPFLFAFGEQMDHTGALEQGRAILNELTAEWNHIIKKWTNFGIWPKGALESQALIQLYNVYCKQKRCLDCQIGTELLMTKRNEKL
jgi:hypothetical protein